MTDTSKFLPLSAEEVSARGWDSVDIVCVTGDSYVDHPSFGISITARVLEAHGCRVAMLAQPDITSDKDFKRYGKPNMAFFVTSGNIDSMVSHYTAAKRKRSDDPYTAGGKAGKRPDRAVIVYCQKIREIYPDANIVIGGLEASLRRFAHYDYWDDAVRPSILLDTKADLLIYGMGELQTRAIVDGFREGKRASEMHDIRGTCYLAQQYELPADHLTCASFHKVTVDKVSHAKAVAIQMENQDTVYGKTLVQKQTDELYLVQNPPMRTLTQQELDEVFDLPYQRMYHPSYEALGGVDAIKEVEFSIMHNRGCFGNCNFCSIAYHQGREIACRSFESILKEAKSFVKNPRFKGYIHDVGGPTANFRHPSCEKQKKHGLCKNRKCLGTDPCPNVNVDHKEYIQLLRELRAIKGIKKVFVRSGLRYDYMMLDKDPTFMREMVEHHISGQLKVAPEHCSQHVLALMGKPSAKVYERFEKAFYDATKAAGKEQYLVPYLMSSHPGSTIEDAIELAVFLKRRRMKPEQVQDFYPTPGTISTCMFFTGLNPLTMEEVYIPRDPKEKHAQRALLQYFKPENRREIIETLVRTGHRDLIGNGPDCLVAPDAKYIREQREYAQKKAAQEERTGGKNNKGSRNASNAGRRGKSRTNSRSSFGKKKG
ncbi:MAG: YgiQ family radical SAM protein [Oscillospiraceae bacterium]|nr:YgiQ family radical SAM protein [Oscillospiraceae bacterium]